MTQAVPKQQPEEVESWPVSRVLSEVLAVFEAIIHLGRQLPGGSSDLPGSSASHALAPLLGLAPDGVYRAVRVATSAVSSYLAISPLPAPASAGRWRYAFCCTFHRLAASGR